MSDITKWSSYETIAQLDPIQFDQPAQQLPKLNDQGDVSGLTDVYRMALDASAGVIKQGLDANNAVAALRDLDFMAGSLIRHGAVAAAEQDIAQTVLHTLGIVAGTVPRGTVFTYAACNPADNRRRTFTGTPGEHLFINSVGEGVNALDACVEALQAGRGGNLSRLLEAQQHLGRMVSSIVEVGKAITPEFFTYQMRPYFDSMTVNQVQYAGAGGAQMQVVAVDRMIWGADCSDPRYAAYYDDNVRYLTPNQRQAIRDFEESTEGRSLMTLIKQGVLPPDAALPTRGLLIAMRKFRYPHRKVANDNFALRAEGSVGSGNYTPTILDILIELNEHAIRQVEAIS